MFERFYGSFLQQPVLLWCAAAVGFVVVAASRSTAASTRTFALAFSVLPFLDAWATADDVAGFGALAPTTATVVSTFFVIAGDYRVFLFLEASTPSGAMALDARKALRALAWSLAIPVGSLLVRALLPDRPWRMRAVFLAYEVAFASLMFARFTRRRAPHAWGLRVVRFVTLYYALWALADALILLAHLDGAYLVRIAANVLYYGFLLAVVCLTAPAGKRADGA